MKAILTYNVSVIAVRAFMSSVFHSLSLLAKDARKKQIAALLHFRLNIFYEFINRIH